MGRRFWIATLGVLIPLTTLSVIVAEPAEAAPATISPASYNFGAVHVWQTKTKDFTLTVAAGYHVDTVDSSPSSDFHAAQSAGCSAPSDTASTKCVITETFAPDEVGLGAESATLEATVCPNAGGACTQLTALVKGDVRLPGALAPAKLAFGSHPAGTTISDTVTIKPDPGVSLDVLTIYPFPAGYPPPFSTTAFTPGCVQAATSCTVSVQYDATDIGLQEDDLTIGFCKPAAQPGERACVFSDVPLSGTATAPATVSPASVDFGTTLHAGGTASKTATLKIAGDWHVSEVATLGDGNGNPYAWDWVSDCDGPGPQTCTYRVIYTPTKTGKSTGILRFTLCAPYVDWWPFDQACTDVEAKLTGSSVAPGSSPTSLSMGTVKVGKQAEKALTVKADPGWVVTGGTSSDSEFSVGECDTVNGRCVLPVLFDPEHLGARVDTITLTLCRPMPGDELCVDLKPVKVTGTGSAPAKISPTSLSFGSVKLGSTKTLTYKVTSDPGWNLSRVHDDTLGPTAYSSAYGPCLAGQSCSVHVTFTPAYSGGAVQAGTSTPVVCREGSELCVQLPAVKLSGRGTS